MSTEPLTPEEEAEWRARWVRILELAPNRADEPEPRYIATLDAARAAQDVAGRAGRDYAQDATPDGRPPLTKPVTPPPDARGADARLAIKTLGEQKAYQAGYDAGHADALAPSMELVPAPTLPAPNPNDEYERGYADGLAGVPR